MSLKGKVAIITGASSGIGAAVAQELASAGVKLVLTARRADRLDRLAKTVPDAVALPGDIVNPELPHRLLRTALERFQRCDIAFNNAGNIEVGSVEKVDIERLAQMVRLNVEAAYRVAYVALRHFRANNSGHLINVSSVLGTKVRPTAGAYAGTKYAIEALTEALRLELAGTNVKVGCIEPGLVLTELHKDWEVHPTQFFNIKQPLLPEDIARCVRFMLEQPDHVRIARMLVLPGEQPL